MNANTRFYCELDEYEQGIIDTCFERYVDAVGMTRRQYFEEFERVANSRVCDLEDTFSILWGLPVFELWVNVLYEVEEMQK